MTRRQINRRKPQRKTRPSSPSPRILHQTSRKQETVSREGTNQKGLEHYKIIFKYRSKGQKPQQETVPVLARDADDALNHAMKQRKIDRKPTNIEIQDGLGDALLKIARGTGKVVGTLQAVKREYETGKIERLVDKSRSGNASEALIARKELRRRYPHIYRSIAYEEV